MCGRLLINLLTSNMQLHLWTFQLLESFSVAIECMLLKLYSMLRVHRLRFFFECRGFSMPMHKGYAQKVFIVTSGEKMACYAAGNIAMAIDNFKGRGYAQLGGLILNRRNVEDELENVQTLAKDFNTVIVGDLERSKLVQECDRLGTTVMNKYPDSDMAKQYTALADEIMKGFEADA